MLLILNEKIFIASGSKRLAGNTCEKFFGHATAINTSFLLIEFVHKGNRYRFLQGFLERVELLKGIFKLVLTSDFGMMPFNIPWIVPIDNLKSPGIWVYSSMSSLELHLISTC